MEEHESVTFLPGGIYRGSSTSSPQDPRWIGLSAGILVKNLQAFISIDRQTLTRDSPIHTELHLLFVVWDRSMDLMQLLADLGARVPA